MCKKTKLEHDHMTDIYKGHFFLEYTYTGFIIPALALVWKKKKATWSEEVHLLDI